MLAYLSMLMKKRRRYAPFSEWPMDKRQKEIHVATHFIRSLEMTGGPKLVHPRLHDPDPPDVVADLRAGGSFAIEVTELVDGHLVSTREHESGPPRFWLAGELSQTIDQVLTRKDSRPFHGGPYEATLVCIFTGEPLVSLDAATKEVGGTSFGPYKHVTGAYLLFPYAVTLERCPLLELTVVA